MSDRDDLVQQFCELTGTSAERVRPLFRCKCHSVQQMKTNIASSQAEEYLTSTKWELSAAVGSFFADADEAVAEPAAGSSSQQPTAQAPPDYTGPRTLDGRPAPQSAFQSTSSSSKKPVRKTGISTLGSLKGDDADNDDDNTDEDDDESQRKGPRDLFAGGEKSGLAVQDPSRGNSSRDPANVIKDILAQAKACVHNLKPLSPD